MNNKKLEKKLEKKLRKRLKNQAMSVDYFLAKIFTGSDLSTRKLPIMKIKSINPGPVIWLTACAHGDEIGGMVVVQEVFKMIKKISLLKGEIYALPLMNPLGIETGSHNIILRSEITPIQENLNRSFPGDKEGSLAERIANKIFELVTETNPSLVLDLHNDWRESIPYLLIDSMPEKTSREIYEKTKFFAKIINFPIILDTTITEKTFTYNLLKENIPALVVEVGESYTINEKDVERGVQAILRILKNLEMIDYVEDNNEQMLNIKIKNKILKYSEEPTSPVSGIIRFFVKPGEIVKKEQAIARVYNAFGKCLETMHSKDESIVLGYSDSSVAFPGLPIMAFGLID